MPPQTDDDSLMAGTARGEEAAFRLLVRRWEAHVRGFLLAMLRSPEDAEDLTQETFVRVFRQAGRYRPEGRFRSWLLRIAGNLARSRLRRRKLLGWLHFDPSSHDVADPGPGADERLDEAARARAVRAAVDRLPDRQREALVLHRYRV